jgi:hypothetical protein
MGLDMYLNATKFVSSGSWRSDADNELFSNLVKAAQAESFIGGSVPTAVVNVSVCYWRKANAIHQWFVSNLSEGVDNCELRYVSREQLTELLDECKKVKVGGKEVAEDALPPQDGFFFGSSEIDESYWEDIDNTIEQLERVLSSVPAGWDFEYQASW